MKRRLKLVESATLGRPQLDKANGIVRGVKILGHKSAHGYSYSKTAMVEARSLYEGKVVNVDHPPKDRLGSSRRYADRFGRLRNVEYREGKGLYGDLHYNRGHVLAEQFEWDVEHDPTNCGLSHNASGAAAEGRNGKAVVESIERVRSVDLVADPATNVGLFEDRGNRMGALLARRKRRKNSKTAESRRAKFNRLLSEAIEAEGEEGAAAMPTPKEAMAKMVMAVFMDESLDTKQRRDKINKILDMDDDGVADSEGGEGEEDSEELPEDRGSRPQKKGNRMAKKNAKKGNGKGNLLESLSSELSDMKRDRRVLELCEDMGFKPTKLQKKVLRQCDTKAEAKELIESFQGETAVSGKKPKAGSKKPKSRTSREDEDDGMKTEDWLEGLTDL